jgi:uncharacterized membrane protein
MSARGWIGWTAATLAVAAVVHFGSMMYLPHFVMSRALAQMGAVNTIHHGRRADATSHGVVRPSPDLLYSSCPFDLSKGDLEIHAKVPQGTYWSVSMFDSNTNNFFVENDRQVKGSGVWLFVIPAKGFLVDLAAKGPPRGPMPVSVRSPTTRGLVLFRTLIADEKDFTALDAARRQATCGTVHNGT